MSEPTNVLPSYAWSVVCIVSFPLPRSYTAHHDMYETQPCRAFRADQTARVVARQCYSEALEVDKRDLARIDRASRVPASQVDLLLVLLCSAKRSQPLLARQLPFLGIRPSLLRGNLSSSETTELARPKVRRCDHGLTLHRGGLSRPQTATFHASAGQYKEKENAKKKSKNIGK